MRGQLCCALRRLTGTVSVNVLMGHQAREIVFGAVSECTTKKKGYFDSLPISKKKSVMFCSPQYITNFPHTAIQLTEI